MGFQTKPPKKKKKKSKTFSDEIRDFFGSKSSGREGTFGDDKGQPAVRRRKRRK